MRLPVRIRDGSARRIPFRVGSRLRVGIPSHHYQSTNSDKSQPERAGRIFLQPSMVSSPFEPLLGPLGILLFNCSFGLDLLIITSKKLIDLGVLTLMLHKF
jgi:hypothetical protein